MISTHILDTSIGKPAAEVAIVLEKKEVVNNIVSWINISSGKTNTDGRLNFNCTKEVGVYRITFCIEDYFKSNKADFFFLDTPIVFQVLSTDRNYHVPLLINPYGLSTYRGS